MASVVQPRALGAGRAPKPAKPERRLLMDEPGAYCVLQPEQPEVSEVPARPAATPSKPARPQRMPRASPCRSLLSSVGGGASFESAARRQWRESASIGFGPAGSASHSTSAMALGGLVGRSEAQRRTGFEGRLRRCSSAGAVRAAAASEPKRSRKPDVPRPPSPGQGKLEAAMARKRWHPGGAENRLPTPPANLGAEDLFNEVIKRDLAFGPLLASIKDAYDRFLVERGIEVPKTAVAVLQEAGAEKPQPQQRATKGDCQQNLEASEVVVDAVRKGPFGLDTTPREPAAGFAKVYELERENAALRRLVKRLRSDASAGKLRPRKVEGLVGMDELLWEKEAAAAAASARSNASSLSAADWGAGPPSNRKVLEIQRRPSFVPGLDFALLVPNVDDEEDDEQTEEDSGGSAGYNSNASMEENPLLPPGTQAWAPY